MCRTLIQNVWCESLDRNTRSRNGRNHKRFCSPPATLKDSSLPKPSQKDIKLICSNAAGWHLHISQKDLVHKRSPHSLCSVPFWLFYALLLLAGLHDSLHKVPQMHFWGWKGQVTPCDLGAKLVFILSGMVFTLDFVFMFIFKAHDIAD